jgi:hypothetical protein
VVFCTEAVLERLGWSLPSKRVAIQGFGSVGPVAARELASRGLTSGTEKRPFGPVVDIVAFTGELQPELGL